MENKKWSQVKGPRSVGLGGGCKMNQRYQFRVSLSLKVTLEQNLEGGEGLGLSDLCWKTLKVKQIALRQEHMNCVWWMRGSVKRVVIGGVRELTWSRFYKALQAFVRTLALTLRGKKVVIGFEKSNDILWLLFWSIFSLPDLSKIDYGGPKVQDLYYTSHWCVEQAVNCVNLDIRREVHRYKFRSDQHIGGN